LYRKEIEEFSKKILENENNINKEVATELETINKASQFSTWENEKLAKRFNECIKYFYKGKTKAIFYTSSKGENTYNSEIFYEISKRGIGKRSNYVCNMHLLNKIVNTKENSYYNGDFEEIFTDEKKFKPLLEKLNDDGKKVFKEIKNLYIKYNLTPIKINREIKIELDNNIKKYVKEHLNVNIVCLTLNVSSNRIYFELEESRDNKNYSGYGGLEIYSYGKENSGLEKQTLRVLFSEQMIDEIKKYNQEIKQNIKNWEEFIMEFNNILAPYSILKLI
jgi:hypothetical protein